jgi:hypothetical protein
MDTSVNSPPAGDTSPEPSPIPARRPMLWIGALALLLGMAGVASALPAVLALGALAGVTALLLAAIFAPGRLGGLLYFAAVATAAFPLDKYFAYQDHVGGWPGMRVALSDLLMVLLAGLALLGWLLDRPRARLPAALCVPYALLLVQYCGSALGAPHRDLAAFEIAAAVHALAVAAVVAALFRRQYLGAVMAGLSVMVLLHTALAAVQVATGRPIGAGLLRHHADVMQELLETGSVRLRPSGLFDHPIIFADFVMLSLPVLAVGALTLPRRLGRVACAGVLLIGVLGMVLTLSRGAWISSVVTAVVFLSLAVRVRLLELRTLRRVGVAAALVVLLAAIPLGPKIVERFTQSQAGNFEVRVELNRIALSMVEAHPVFGVGLNNFLSVLSAYDPKDVARTFPATVHNIYLLEASEAGIPGLLLFLATGAGLLFWTVRRLPLISDPPLRWLALAVLSGLIGFAVSQLADFSHRLEPLRTFLWTLVGLMVGAVRVGLAKKEQG